MGAKSRNDKARAANWEKARAAHSAACEERRNNLFMAPTDAMMRAHQAAQTRHVSPEVYAREQAEKLQREAAARSEAALRACATRLANQEQRRAAPVPKPTRSSTRKPAPGAPVATQGGCTRPEARRRVSAARGST